MSFQFVSNLVTSTFMQLDFYEKGSKKNKNKKKQTFPSKLISINAKLFFSKITNY